MALKVLSCRSSDKFDLQCSWASRKRCSQSCVYRSRINSNSKGPAAYCKVFLAVLNATSVVNDEMLWKVLIGTENKRDYVFLSFFGQKATWLSWSCCHFGRELKSKTRQEYKKQTNKQTTASPSFPLVWEWAANDLTVIMDEQFL